MTLASLKTLKIRQLPGATPLGPHQGFALDPLGAALRPPNPLPLCAYTSFLPWLCP